MCSCQELGVEQKKMWSPVPGLGVRPLPLAAAFEAQTQLEGVTDKGNPSDADRHGSWAPEGAALGPCFPPGAPWSHLFQQTFGEMLPWAGHCVGRLGHRSARDSLIQSLAPQSSRPCRGAFKGTGCRRLRSTPDGLVRAGRGSRKGLPGRGIHIQE